MIGISREQRFYRFGIDLVSRRDIFLHDGSDGRFILGVRLGCHGEGREEAKREESYHSASLPRLRYGGVMKASTRLRARQWSRAAWALAILFASLPVSSRVFLGAWGFESAGGVAALCFVAGTYLHLLARKALRAMPDPAAVLDEALEMARDGRVKEAMAVLTEAIRINPWLWQAYQYRGELYLAQQSPDLAAADFSEAVRLAPDERHLRELLEQAQSPNRFGCSLE